MPPFLKCARQFCLQFEPPFSTLDTPLAWARGWPLYVCTLLSIINLTRPLTTFSFVSFIAFIVFIELLFSVHWLFSIYMSKLIYLRRLIDLVFCIIILKIKVCQSLDSFTPWGRVKQEQATVMNARCVTVSTLPLLTPSGTRATALISITDSCNYKADWAKRLRSREEVEK